MNDFQIFFKENLTKENVISRLKALDSIGSSSEREIEFVASHLIDLDTSPIFEMNDSMISKDIHIQQIQAKNNFHDLSKCVP
jgi:hypothetical protein